jgi:cytidine deaminase
MLTPDLKQALISAAIETRNNAYAGYSNYLVGAALLSANGQVFFGANVENAVYPLTICAERAAVASAVSQGERKFVAIAVVTKDGGSPCGSCRQVLSEFGQDILVIIANDQGKVLHELTIGELLPAAFDSTNLENSGE